MPALSMLWFTDRDRYPQRCDSVPTGRSRIGRGFHPKKTRRIR